MRARSILLVAWLLPACTAEILPSQVALRDTGAMLGDAEATLDAATSSTTDAAPPAPDVGPRDALADGGPAAEGGIEDAAPDAAAPDADALDSGTGDAAAADAAPDPGDGSAAD